MDALLRRSPEVYGQEVKKEQEPTAMQELEYSHQFYLPNTSQPLWRIQGWSFPNRYLRGLFQFSLRYRKLRKIDGL